MLQPVTPLKIFLGLIKGAGRKKLRLRAGRFDLALIDNNDLIGVRNGGQPVGNDQQRLAPHQPSQCRLDDRLVFRVCIGRCLVENDDRRVLQHGTGNGDALPLTAGQVTAGCTAYGLIQKAIEQDGLPWIHVSDLQAWGNPLVKMLGRISCAFV